MVRPISRKETAVKVRCFIAILFIPNRSSRIVCNGPRWNQIEASGGATGVEQTLNEDLTRTLRAYIPLDCSLSLSFKEISTAFLNRQAVCIRLKNSLLYLYAVPCFHCALYPTSNI